MSNWLGQLVANQIKPTDTVLDLGCGNLCTTGRLGAFHLAVDGFLPYLDAIKASGPTMQGFLPHIGEKFPDKSYDIVLLLDVMEHLLEGDHEAVIRDAERIARKKVIVFSPDGMMAQEPWDAWGLGFNVLQEHLSAVHSDDFRKLGYGISMYATKNHAGAESNAFLAIKSV